MVWFAEGVGIGGYRFLIFNFFKTFLKIQLINFFCHWGIFVGKKHVIKHCKQQIKNVTIVWCFQWKLHDAVNGELQDALNGS